MFPCYLYYLSFFNSNEPNVNYYTVFILSSLFRYSEQRIFVLNVFTIFSWYYSSVHFRYDFQSKNTLLHISFFVGFVCFHGNLFCFFFWVYSFIDNLRMTLNTHARAHTRSHTHTHTYIYLYINLN